MMTLFHCLYVRLLMIHFAKSRNRMYSGFFLYKQSYGHRNESDSDGGVTVLAGKFVSRGAASLIPLGS